MIARRAQVLVSLVLLLGLVAGPQCTCAHAAAPASDAPAARNVPGDHPCCSRERAPRSGDSRPMDAKGCPHCGESAAAQTSKVEVPQDVPRSLGPALTLAEDTDPQADLAARRRQVPGQVMLEPASGRSLLSRNCTLLI